MSRFRTLPRATGARVATVLVAAGAAAAVATPIATGAGEGSNVRAGERNPANGRSLSSETQIIASNGDFGTRQSNKGTGGGAIYGCRAPASGKGCIEAANLNNGQAFNFRFRGESGGTITTNATDKDGSRPFTTNATGVATGLNADRVDGKDAQQIVDEAVSRTKMGVVNAEGALANQRGLSASAREGTGKYLVTADADITKCVPNVTAYGDAPGAQAAIQPVGANQLRVFTQNNQGEAADRQFALTINC
jgi:hypothetical protein